MIEEIPYNGWKRNLQIRAGGFELVITLDVGPRILRYAFEGGDNVFCEFPEMMGRSGENEWMIRGGHRFWTAPEGRHSYALDNEAVKYEKTGKRSVEIISPKTKEFGLRKKLRVAMDKQGGVSLEHELVNIGDEPLKLAPWGLSVMRPGGSAVLPQPTLGRHPSEQPEGTPENPSDLLPNRNLVLWNYTDLSDPRLELGPELWRVHHRHGMPATKLGLYYRGGWCGYQLVGQVFCKKVPTRKGKPYPDGGCNLEVFTNDQMLELETLAPAVPIKPGDSALHAETWRLVAQHEPLETPEKANAFFGKLGD